MTMYMIEKWKMALVLALALLMSLVCAGDLYAQIQADEVDFEILATVVYGENDSLWNLAGKYYSNSWLWPLIAYLNRIPDYNAIPVGTTIYIPVKEPKKAILGKAEIYKLSTELEKLQREHLSVSKEYEVYKTVKRQLEQELKDRDATINQVRTTADELSTRIQEQQKGLLRVNQEYEACKVTVDELSAKSAELQKELLRVNEEREALETREQQLARTVEDKDTTINELENALDKAIAAPQIIQMKELLVDEPESGLAGKWKLTLGLTASTCLVLSLLRIF